MRDLICGYNRLMNNTVYKSPLTNCFTDVSAQEKNFFSLDQKNIKGLENFYMRYGPPLFSKFCINDLLKVFVFSIKHNISTLETINFNLLYKNKERFGSWETAILITKAISKDEATITK